MLTSISFSLQSRLTVKRQVAQKQYAGQRLDDSNYIVISNLSTVMRHRPLSTETHSERPITAGGGQAGGGQAVICMRSIE